MASTIAMLQQNAFFKPEYGSHNNKILSNGVMRQQYGGVAGIKTQSFTDTPRILFSMDSTIATLQQNSFSKP